MNRNSGKGSFSRGRGRGGGVASNTARPSQGRQPNTSATPDSVPMDMVRPNLPPLYPDYNEGVAMDQMDIKLNTLASDFIHVTEYLRSNYSIHYLEKKASGFDVHKFTDTYDDPFRVEPRLKHFIDKKFFPKELYTSKTVRKKHIKEVDTTTILEKYTVKENKRHGDSDSENETKRKKQRLDQVDITKAENLELEKATKSLDPEMVDVDDDEEVEVDEEMDDGNDYQNDYFDNGEDYLSEDDALEDGNVF